MGDIVSRLWITGYRSYELGVFKDDDPKRKVIDYVLTNELRQAIIDGTDWIISGGQLGVEQWALEAANYLKSEYPDEFQTSMMLPFAEFGNNWNEKNQLKLQKLRQSVDFSASVSQQPYHSPQQLRNYQEFMLNHTDQVIMIYDLDNPGKSQYDFDKIKEFADSHPYPYRLITFDDLQNAADEYQENQNNSFQDD
ncbi:hypothetical protein B2D45_01505 [Lactobacillus hilgardii]|uniref:UPF0398 protein HMPREF0519_2210 n=1 Tax=Lentilactobacillus hilgardii (strain ATCC 8290 / DSM 20176 / CCUG 30140 / JCM 1155 / KCTC 3500 / NBRC 15886 / NCIMB 8040 / NRRL B-1843 / 9) TaxID=1423757 RepID=C0XLS0_LENH9|nr:hypothetical protein HMPREF0519_2210 [Lentilactobacillus hilgardii DSM 20176 = ATCC 8290]KRK56520.1 hypothetical protein FD42_GL000460 [Lentilactobacillus hilgardii DSM 20176 = ATCC 8290]QEU38577.1 DUF1273 domain-containing protein [Lentilactobacillus hilgardii]TDG80825.1 hypothetical protein C5L34_001533 [Lentilactobacillus hilgardii]